MLLPQVGGLAAGEGAEGEVLEGGDASASGAVVLARG